jgi:hypothetical protein
MKIAQDIKREMLRRYEALRIERQTNVDSMYRDIQTYLLPDHGLNLTAGGDNKEQKVENNRSAILDDTGGKALDVLSSGLMAGLTSPARPWFRLGTRERIEMNDNLAKEWLFTVEEELRASFSRSSAYKALHHAYIELAGFGTAAIEMIPSDETGLSFKAFTAGEYYFTADFNGKIDSFYRELYLTARQLVREFGIENVSERVANAYRSGRMNTARFKVVHAVEPSSDELDLKDVMGRPFRSVYMEVDGPMDNLLRVRGYDEMPMMCPRWTVVGNQTYGRSIAMKVLPDIKQLQHETDLKLEGLHKVVEPPVKAPGHPSDLVVNSFPGGVTFDVTAGGGDARGLSPLYEVAPDINALRADIADVQRRIREGFFNDIFLMLAGGNVSDRMTAREIAERHEEKMLILGPVLERLQDELLTPMIDRAFRFLVDSGRIPEIPPSLADSDLKVEYISILAQAQKDAGRLQGLNAITQFVSAVSALNPESLDKFDLDEAIDIYADAVGVPPSVIVSDEDVAKIREARAEAAANREAAEQQRMDAETLAKTASAVADAPFQQSQGMIDQVVL